MKIKKMFLNDGKKYSFQEHINEFLLTREEASTSEIFTVVVPVGGKTHYQTHPDMEQIFFVLQGEGIIETNDQGVEEYITLDKGSIVWIPINAPHKVINTHDSVDLKYLCVNSFDITSKTESTSIEHAENVVEENCMTQQPILERPVCIVGAAGFIGHELVEVLKKEGKYIWGIDCANKPNDERCTYFDVSECTDYTSFLLGLCEKHHICPEGLILAVGNNSIHKHSLNMSDEEFASQIEDNLTVAFKWINAYAKCCVKYGLSGKIIALSSIGAKRNHREMCGYDSAKGGLETLCRGLALDYIPFNITINVMEIGPIKESPSSINDGEGEVAKALRSLMPSGEYPLLRDITKYIAYFYGNVPAFLTGQIIALDGALSIQLRPLAIERLEAPQMYERKLTNNG